MLHKGNVFLKLATQRRCDTSCGQNCACTLPLHPRLHERFFTCHGDAIVLKIVASPARGENRRCSPPRTGDREKFNEFNFLRQNLGLCRSLSPSVATRTRWRCDSFQKISSPSQAKNRSCSRSFRNLSLKLNLVH